MDVTRPVDAQFTKALPKVEVSLPLIYNQTRKKER